MCISLASALTLSYVLLLARMKNLTRSISCSLLALAFTLGLDDIAAVCATCIVVVFLDVFTFLSGRFDSRIPTLTLSLELNFDSGTLA